MVSCQSTDFDREVGRHSQRKSPACFTRGKLLPDFQCLALVCISMPCILSLYQTPKGGAAKLSFATPPAVEKGFEFAHQRVRFVFLIWLLQEQRVQQVPQEQLEPQEF